MTRDTLIANDLRLIASKLDRLGFKIWARKLTYAASLLN